MEKISKRILCIDDENLTLETVELILTKAGYYVQTSLSGKNVFDQIKSFQPDLILLDIVLADEDGRDICRNIKNNPSTKTIPVIILSAHPEVFQTIIDNCANDVVSKPFEIDQLLFRIERQLKQVSSFNNTFYNSDEMTG
ncbi:response regulator [Rubrolithibacter danxiaensis]|uniref:response regulator n=1 Tax=Rubrolithibacter danxiaensis TaxID=3390805 RepID=UPI003BF842A3